MFFYVIPYWAKVIKEAKETSDFIAFKGFSNGFDQKHNTRRLRYIVARCLKVFSLVYVLLLLQLML